MIDRTNRLKGSLYVFELPSAVESCPMSHPDKLVDNPPSVDEAPPKRKILLIDDGDSVQDGIRLFMEREGFEVYQEPADGLQAVEQANKFKPDLILWDLAMPQRNGASILARAQTLSLISQTMPDVPIVLLTLSPNVLGPELSSAVGVTAIIDKAAGLDKLIECVRSLLAQPGREVLRQRV
jgi:DNA-binding NarL/FixJ family response regulator